MKIAHDHDHVVPALNPCFQGSTDEVAGLDMQEADQIGPIRAKAHEFMEPGKPVNTQGF